MMTTIVVLAFVLQLQSFFTLKAYARALRLERAKFCKRFSYEFKFTQKTMVHSVRDKRNTNVFKALLVWQVDLSSEPKNEIITVLEAWVKEQFGELMLQQIINIMRQVDHGWTQTPRDVAVFIGTWKIARVKYLSKSVRFITDVQLLVKKLKKLKTMEAELNSKSNQKKKAGKKRKVPPQDYETQRSNLIRWKHLGLVKLKCLCKLPLDTFFVIRSWL